MKFTPEEKMIYAYLHTLGHEDGITEIRILDAGLYGGKVVRRNRATISGYYDGNPFTSITNDVFR